MLIELLILFLLTLIGNLFIFIAGYVILSIILKPKSLNVWMRFSMSYGLGLGLTGFSMFLFNLIGIHVRLSYIPLVIVILVIFSAKKVYKELVDDLRDIYASINLRKLKIIDKISIVIFCLISMYILAYWSMYPIYEWDALAIWDARAKFLFFEGNLSFLEELDVQEGYPLLISYSLAFFYSLYSQYFYFSKVIFPSIFLSLMCFIYGSLRLSNLNRTYSLLITLLIASFNDLIYHATIAYADLPLAYFYTTALITSLLYFKELKNRLLLCSSIFNGFMMWIKQEGFFLFLINLFVFLMFLIVFLVRKRVKLKVFLLNILYFLSISIITYLPWNLIIVYYNFGNVYLDNINQIFKILTKFERIMLIFYYFHNFPIQWKIYWIFTLLILSIHPFYLKDYKSGYLLVSYLLHFMLIIAAYIVTPYPLDWHLENSLDREILHLVPLNAYLLYCALRKEPRIVNMDIKFI